MKKVTKKAQREYLKHKLRTDEKWAFRALIKIYHSQTEDEKSSHQTHDDNGIGFTGFDGNILSNFAEFYLLKKRLSFKQREIVLGKMPKYWNQILAISDVNKLNALILEQ